MHSDLSEFNTEPLQQNQAYRSLRQSSTEIVESEKKSSLGGMIFAIDKNWSLEMMWHAVESVWETAFPKFLRYCLNLRLGDSCLANFYQELAS